MKRSANLPEVWNGCPRCRGISAHDRVESVPIFRGMRNQHIGDALRVRLDRRIGARNGDIAVQCLTVDTLIRSCHVNRVAIASLLFAT